MRAAKREALEIWIGTAVAAIMVVVVALVFSPLRIDDDTYRLTARFNRADGLSPGSMVQAAGIPVGKIDRLDLDQNYRAVAVLRIDRGVALDAESTAAIVTDGLFGDKFVQLDIGGSDTMLGDGDEIAFTEDSLILDDLLELIVSRAKSNRPAGATPETTQ